MIAGILFSTPIIKLLKEKACKSKISCVTVAVGPVICLFLFLWSVSYIILGAHNPFIYFNF